MTSSSYVAYIDRLLSMVSLMKGTYTIKVDSIHSYYSTIPLAIITNPRQIDQLVRAFIFYLLGTTLFHNTGSSIDLMLLMPLQDLDLIASFN